MMPIPLQRIVTDVSEFKCLKHKNLYLSPIMDFISPIMLRVITTIINRKQLEH